jgi:hypothetical protein
VAKLPDNVKELMSKGHNVWVATVGADGAPNISIKGSGALLDDEHLYFADMFSKKTRDNLLNEQYYREEAEAEARAFADEDDPGEEDLGGHVPGQFGKEEDPLAFDAHRERQRFGHKPSRD